MKNQPAKISYFFGKGYRDLWATIKESWFRNLEKAGDFFGEVPYCGWIKKIFYITAALAVVIFGTIWFLVLSVLHISLLFTFFLIVYFLFTFVWILDYLFRLKEQAFAACPNPRCYKKSSLPIYHCSKSGAEHSQLWPSKYGILKRTCNCGENLPCTFFNGRGKLRATCPHCHKPISTEEGTPVIIPLVGPPTSGKTTYLYSLLENIEKDAKQKGYEFRFSSRSTLNQKLYEEQVNTLNAGGKVKKTVHNDALTAVDVILSKGSKKYAIYFYDPAGESFEKIEYLKDYNFYEYYNAMIFMMDPFAIEQVRETYYEQLQKDGVLATYRSAQGLEDTFNSLKTNLAKTYNIKETERVKQKLAIVIPKTDLYGLDQTFQGDNEDKASRLFILGFGQKQFLDNMDWKFKNIRFFHVASKGKDSVGVMAPFEWILGGEIRKTRIRRFFSNVLMAIFVAVTISVFATAVYFIYKSLPNISWGENRRTEVIAPVIAERNQPNYYCTANSLNIRSSANKNADIVGKLIKNQEVYVHSIDNGFAKIDFNSKIAYVSADYLLPKDASTTNSKYTKPVTNSLKSGWSTFLLQGEVKQVTYDDGKYIYFNTDGNVVKHNVRRGARGREEFEYVYSSPTRFVLKGDESFPFKIVHEGTTRREIWDNSEALGLTFTYDEANRLIGVSEPDYGFGISETYVYDGKNTYPSKLTIEYYDETGSISNVYTYSGYTIDSHENWTHRTVNHETKEITYIEDGENTETTTLPQSYTESREIFYF